MRVDGKAVTLNQISGREAQVRPNRYTLGTARNDPSREKLCLSPCYLTVNCKSTGILSPVLANHLGRYPGGSLRRARYEFVLRLEVESPTSREASFVLCHCHWQPAEVHAECGPTDGDARRESRLSG